MLQRRKSTRQNSLLTKWGKLSKKWASSFRLTRARVRAYQGFCTFCFHNLHTRGVESRSSEINIKELQQKMSDIFSETSDFFQSSSEVSLEGMNWPLFFAEMMNPYHPIHPSKSSLKHHSATSHRTGIFLSVFFFRLILQLSKSLLRASKHAFTRTPFLLPS